MNKITLNDKLIAPSKIVCIGRNYYAHIEELKNEVPEEMVIFLKPNSAISEHLSCAGNEEIHYEAELAFLIQGGKIHALGFGLDLTKRHLQNRLKEKGLPWERAKAFDGSAVFSHFIEFNGDINKLSLVLSINQRQVQQGCVASMIYKPAQILKEVGLFMSMCDGDILMSGTPKGVGKINSGDYFEATVFAGEKCIIDAKWQVP
nr:fumarylacetoacetate hydrolase family protein [Psychromonas sp. CNPT3]